MSKKSLFFWGSAIFLLFIMLGSADLWTQEWRWADIVWRMRVTADYFHPNLAGDPYYDKPLLSYWLMLPATQLLGMNEAGLRLPSAIAGLITLACTMHIGKIIYDKKVAALTGWVLLTTYFFVFWSRIASSDMLNVAGIMLAVAWYFSRSTKPSVQQNGDSIFGYAIFFLILAVASLIKGPVAIVIAGIAIFADLLTTKTLHKNLNLRVLIALIPAVIVYLLPFLFAHQSDGQENSLYQVYRENVLRFFAPFDHKDPWYSYFIYLPVYLLPWIFYVIPLLWVRGKSVFAYRQKTPQQQGLLLAIFLIFLFFSISGSRRSYYILPLVPFVVLWIAEQINLSRWQQSVKYFIASFYALLILWFGILQPLYYQQCGLKPFAQLIKQRAIEIKPWNQWRVIMVEADNRIGFYLQPERLPLSYRFFADAKNLEQQLVPPVILLIKAKNLPQVKPWARHAEVVAVPSCRFSAKQEDPTLALLLK